MRSLQKNLLQHLNSLLPPPPKLRNRKKTMRQHNEGLKPIHSSSRARFDLFKPDRRALTVYFDAQLPENRFTFFWLGSVVT